MSDRLELLANNNDTVRSGVNNRRVQRIRQYDAEIARLREIDAEANQAQGVINDGAIFGTFIAGELRNRCLQIQATCRTELVRLEHERNLISRQVQRREQR